MSANDYTLVLGLGATGASCVRFLAPSQAVLAMDSRPNPPFAAQIAAAFPNVKIHLGSFNADVIAGAAQIIASPGIANLDAITAPARARGVRVRSDIDLFAAHARAPVIGITGTNGKSTVTTLVGELLAAAGMRVAVGGNLGTPALDLLAPEIEVYVLELSSFQIDITTALRCHAATVLNVTPDHLDRYGTLATYAASKARIYLGAQTRVWNRADAATFPAEVQHAQRHAAPTDSSSRAVSFGLDAPASGMFGISVSGGQRYLSLGPRLLIDTNQLQLRGTHNEENALAALALVQALGVDLAKVLPALSQFAGLPHRCQPVGRIGGVEFINDSKATNEGAALAALAGVGAATQGRIVLIAGGDGKGADFQSLAAALPGPVRLLVTIGRDGPRLGTAVGSRVAQVAAGDLATAVRIAFAAAQAGDCVLLAPACASLDQFRNFEHRGDVFAAQVQALAAEVAAGSDGDGSLDAHVRGGEHAGMKRT